MTDNGLAALAAALYAGDDALRSMAEARGAAAAILGERGLFLPDGHGLCGIQDAMTITEQAATIATLRAALVGLVEAAEDILRGDEHDALRAALATAYAATCSAESDQQVSATKEAGG